MQRACNGHARPRVPRLWSHLPVLQGAHGPPGAGLLMRAASSYRRSMPHPRSGFARWLPLLPHAGAACRLGLRSPSAYPIHGPVPVSSITASLRALRGPAQLPVPSHHQSSGEWSGGSVWPVHEYWPRPWSHEHAARALSRLAGTLVTCRRHVRRSIAPAVSSTAWAVSGESLFWACHLIYSGRSAYRWFM